MDECVLPPVCHPDFRRPDGLAGLQKGLPVRVVTDDEREFHPAHPGALPHLHPARCEADDGVRQAPRPAIRDGGGRRENDTAAHLLLAGGGRRAKLPQWHAERLIECAHRQQGAVQPERRVIPRLTQQGDEPLRLAERIAADHMRAPGEERDVIEQACDFALRIRVTKNRQRECGLGDEKIAGHEFERGACCIRRALVIPADDGPLALILDHDLRATQHMAGRGQPEGGIADPQRLPIAEGLLGRAGAVLSHAPPHDRQRLRRGEHVVIAGACVVGMPVGDDGLLNREKRVDVEVAWRAEKALRRGV